ncbi:MAG: hypothetical protein PHE33_08575 [Bacteroidales bacterium]|nr:hypothetical protein [Bacteroidales bacterium]
MKKRLIFLIYVLFTISIFSVTSLAQGVAINTNNSNADPSAMLDIQSTKSGLLTPRMTQLQRNAISLPATGLIIFQTDNNSGFYYYNGITWSRIGDGYGTITSISTQNGITGGTITSSGTIGLTGQALALHNVSTNGFFYRNGSTINARSIAVSGNAINITNGSGASGNPTISLNIGTGATQVAAGYHTHDASHVVSGEFDRARVRRMISSDTRSVNPEPQAYEPTFQADFKSNSTDGLSDGGTYHGVMSFRPYGSTGDFSGGPMHQLGFTQSGNLWIRSSTSSTTWGDWTKFITSNNLGSVNGTTNYVSKFTSANSLGDSQIFDNGTNVGIGTTSVSYKLDVAGTGSFSSSLRSQTFGIQNSSSSSGYGISLYNGPTSGQPTYGLMFAGTSTYQTHGYVSADWATYFTMNDNTTRGWIFRRNTVNVASISGGGDLTVNGRIRVGDNVQTEIYSNGNRVKFKAENVDGIGEFASYGLYLPITAQTYNLYLAGSLKIGENEAGHIDIRDANTRITEGNGNSIRLQTNSGYVDIGPQNSSWSHFSTDRTRFYFNTGITIDSGLIGTYDDDMQLQTSGTTRLTVLNSNGNVGINTTTPNAKLDIKEHTNSGIMLYLTDDDNSSGENAHKALQIQTQSTVQSWIATNGDAFFNGNIGIGTTAPDEKLHVVGNTKISSLSGTGNRMVYTDANGVLKAGSGNDNTNWTLSANFSYSPDDLWGHGGTSGGTLSGDDATAPYTMPFSLTIEGTSYNVLTISTNGWVAFGSVSSSYFSNNCLPTYTFSVPVICAYWDDLAAEGSNIRYGYVGSSPNRTVIIDYEAKTYSNNYPVRFQVQIHEGSGLINVKYRHEMSPFANGQSATIGFQLAGGLSAKAFPITCNGKVLDDNRDDAEAWSVCPVR